MSFNVLWVVRVIWNRLPCSIGCFANACLDLMVEIEENCAVRHSFVPGMVEISIIQTRKTVVIDSHKEVRASNTQPMGSQALFDLREKPITR